MDNDQFEREYKKRFPRGMSGGPEVWVAAMEFRVRNTPALAPMLHALTQLGHDTRRMVFFDEDPGSRSGNNSTFSVALRPGEFATFEWDGVAIIDWEDHQHLEEPVASIIKARFAEAEGI